MYFYLDTNLKKKYIQRGADLPPPPALTYPQRFLGLNHVYIVYSCFVLVIILYSFVWMIYQITLLLSLVKSCKKLIFFDKTRREGYIERYVFALSAIDFNNIIKEELKVEEVVAKLLILIVPIIFNILDILSNIYCQKRQRNFLRIFFIYIKNNFNLSEQAFFCLDSNNSW